VIKNHYTNSLEKIIAPKNLVEKTINKLYSENINNEVINMKRTKCFKLKLTSAIAASLILILMLSVIMYGRNNSNSSDNPNSLSHPFMITVKAADNRDSDSTTDEITHESYVRIDNIKNFGQGFIAQPHGYVNENNEYIIIHDGLDLLELSKEFTLALTCTGENIKSITYTAHNTYLTYMQSYQGLLTTEALTSEEKDLYDANTSFDHFGFASSCTFDYYAQPKSTLDFEIPEDSLDGTIPLRIAFNFELEEGKYSVPSLEDEHLMPIFEKVFNEHAEKYALDVTANFKDGTSTTKTLNFKCENDGQHLYLCAIEDNN